METPEDPVPPRRDRLRLAAFVGAIASAVVVAAFFLPWIYVPREDIPRLRDATAPGLVKYQAKYPDATHDFEVALTGLEKDGYADGIELFVFSRAARRLNEAILESEGWSRRPVDDRARELRVRRAYRTASIVLLGLPIASLLLVVHFVAHGFRRARSPTLILLTIVGVVGGALATSWYVFSNALDVVKVFTGDGVRATLVASFTQAAAGVFGVTGRNWWRVYVGSLTTLLALAIVVWAYVWQGVTL